MFFTAARYPHRCAYQHRCAYSALPHHISKEKAHRNYYSDELLILFSTRCLSSTRYFSSTLHYHTRKCGSSPPPENKNFSGKGKLAVENHSLSPHPSTFPKKQKRRPEKTFLLEKERAHKEVYKNRIKVGVEEKKKTQGMRRNLGHKGCRRLVTREIG